MQEPKNKKALETGSGIAWKDWLTTLEPHKTLNHTEMAEVAQSKLLEIGKSKSPEWWAQGITVAYEQHIGRRQPGQTCDGNFSVTVTKTVPGAIDAALTAWLGLVANEVKFNGVKISIPGKISRSDRWRYWRCGLADGSKVSVNIQTKPSGDKSSLAINHDKLASAKDVESWRAFWKSFTL